MSQPPEDDKTLAVPAGRLGGAAPSPSHVLPSGSLLREYEIIGLIGEGGFGIVYFAYDHSLQRRVAVKEYMPAGMASRAGGSREVFVKSERHAETFRLGLKSFVNEARLLARFDHPSLVKVYRYWEENGTAYMVMPYYDGPTLKQALADLGRPPDEAELRAWLHPLLDALAVMHAARCYHRDIAPDNILVLPKGPLLLDFGAARHVIGDMTHAPTVLLKPGYAPIEQYGEAGGMTQGAWTDLYALACVVHFAITGKAPMSSVERLMGDQLQPLGTLAAGRYSVPLLQAIDGALAVRPKDRPQSVAEFRDLLDGRGWSSPPMPDFAATLPGEFGETLPPDGYPPWTPPASAQPVAQPTIYPLPTVPPAIVLPAPAPEPVRVRPAPKAAAPQPADPATWMPAAIDAPTELAAAPARSRPGGSSPWPGWWRWWRPRRLTSRCRGPGPAAPAETAETNGLTMPPPVRAQPEPAPGPAPVPAPTPVPAAEPAPARLPSSRTRRRPHPRRSRPATPICSAAACRAPAGRCPRAPLHRALPRRSTRWHRRSAVIFCKRHPSNP